MKTLEDAGFGDVAVHVAHQRVVEAAAAGFGDARPLFG
jgi:hypothetical protein